LPALTQTAAIVSTIFVLSLNALLLPQTFRVALVSLPRAA
jgi:hypothetical protein